MSKTTQYGSLFVTCLFALYGCTQPVGQQCTYGKPLKGNGTIKSISHGECIVDFRSDNRVWAKWSVEKRFQDMGAWCWIMGKVGVGRTYRAIYQQEMEGSCNPYRVILYDKTFINKQPNIAKKYHLE